MPRIEVAQADAAGEHDHDRLRPLNAGEKVVDPAAHVGVGLRDELLRVVAALDDHGALGRHAPGGGAVARRRVGQRIRPTQHMGQGLAQQLRLDVQGLAAPHPRHGVDDCEGPVGGQARVPNHVLAALPEASVIRPGAKLAAERGLELVHVAVAVEVQPRVAFALG